MTKPATKPTRRKRTDKPLDPRAQAQGLAELQAAWHAYRELRAVLRTLPADPWQPRHAARLERLRQAIGSCLQCGDSVTTRYAFPLDAFLDGKGRPRKGWRDHHPRPDVHGGVPVGLLQQHAELAAFRIEMSFERLQGWLDQENAGAVKSAVAVLAELVDATLSKLRNPADLTAEVARLWSVVAPPQCARQAGKARSKQPIGDRVQAAIFALHQEGGDYASRRTVAQRIGVDPSIVSRGEGKRSFKETLELLAREPVHQETPQRGSTQSRLQGGKMRANQD